MQRLALFRVHELMLVAAQSCCALAPPSGNCARVCTVQAHARVFKRKETTPQTTSKEMAWTTWAKTWAKLCVGAAEDGDGCHADGRGGDRLLL